MYGIVCHQDGRPRLIYCTCPYTRKTVGRINNIKRCHSMINRLMITVLFITFQYFGCKLFSFSAVSDHSYYMTGNLAILEQRIMNSVSDYLRLNGFEQLAGPDMVKGLIAVS